MSITSPSLLFTQYTDLLCDQTLEEMLEALFGTTCEFSCFCAVSWCSVSHSAFDDIYFCRLPGNQLGVPSHPWALDWSAGTGVASGPRSTLPSWAGCISPLSRQLPQRGGKAVRRGGTTGGAHNGGGKVAKCCLMTCLALKIISSLTVTTSPITFLLEPRT